MWLVVGLGNPGPEYVGTRHNVGFEVIDRLADRFKLPSFKSFKKAEVSKGRVAGEESLLVKPMTFMNLSGDAVGVIMRYYKAETGKIIVVHDELDFEPGEVRLKRGGGHGGHNGLKSIMSHAGREFIRVRVGIGKPRGNGADHVLTRFDSKTRMLVDESVVVASEAVETILQDGLPAAMNRFNRAPETKKKKKKSANEKSEQSLADDPALKEE